MSAVLALVTFVIALQGTDAWAWQSSAGGAFVDASALALDAHGDVVVAGRNIDSSLNSDSAGDTLFVAKLSGTSEVLRWRTVVSEPVPFSQDRLEAVAFDARGDVFAVGTLFRPAEFMVVKLSGATGEELWRYAARGCSQISLAVAVDAAGDVVTAGPVCGQPYAFPVLKLAGASGEVRWHQTLPAEEGDWVRAVAVDAHGDVAAVGSITNRFTVVKLSGADGGVLWRRTSGRGWANAVAFDRVGDLVAVGASRGAGVVDFAVAKLAGRSGTLRWRHVIRGSARTFYDSEEETSVHPQHEGLALAMVPSGDVIAGGYLQNLKTSEDFFVVKLAGRGGSERWRRVIKGVGINYRDERRTTRKVEDRASVLALDPQGDVIAAGRIQVPAFCLGLGVVKLARQNGGELWRFQGCEGAGMASAVALDAEGHPVVAAVDTRLAGVPVRKLRGDTGADF